MLVKIPVEEGTGDHIHCERISIAALEFFLYLCYGESIIYLLKILPKFQTFIGCLVQYGSPFYALDQTVFSQQLDIWINDFRVKVCLIYYIGLTCAAVTYTEDLRNNRMSASPHYLASFRF
jgi:hypothetical protein